MRKKPSSPHARPQLLRPILQRRVEPLSLLKMCRAVDQIMHLIGIGLQIVQFQRGNGTIQALRIHLNQHTVCCGELVFHAYGFGIGTIPP